MSQLISLHPPPVGAATCLPPRASSSSSLPILHLSSSDRGRQPRFPAIATKAKPNRRAKTLLEPQEVSEIGDEDDVEDEGGGVDAFPFGDGFTAEEGGGGEENSEGDEDGVLNSSGGYGGRGDGKDYDKDPELAEILASCFDDPQKAQSRVTLTSFSYSRLCFPFLLDLGLHKFKNKIKNLFDFGLSIMLLGWGEDKEEEG